MQCYIAKALLESFDPRAPSFSNCKDYTTTELIIQLINPAKMFRNTSKYSKLLLIIPKNHDLIMSLILDICVLHLLQTVHRSKRLCCLWKQFIYHTVAGLLIDL